MIGQKEKSWKIQIFYGNLFRLFASKNNAQNPKNPLHAHLSIIQKKKICSNKQSEMYESTSSILLFSFDASIHMLRYRPIMDIY